MWQDNAWNFLQIALRNDSFYARVHTPQVVHLPAGKSRRSLRLFFSLTPYNCPNVRTLVDCPRESFIPSTTSQVFFLHAVILDILLRICKKKLLERPLFACCNCSASLLRNQCFFVPMGRANCCQQKGSGLSPPSSSLPCAIHHF